MSQDASVSRRGFLRAAGGATAVAGASGSAAAQDAANETATGTAATPTGSPNGTATGTPDDAGGETHRVEMTDSLEFSPAELTISPGDTVVWETVGSQGHSVTVYEDEIPDGAEYFASGDHDSEQAAREAYTVGDPDSGDVPSGETYEHTFEVEGGYEYFCIPHEGAGMTGTVQVGEGGATDPDDGGGTPTAEAQIGLARPPEEIAVGAVAGLFMLLTTGGMLYLTFLDQDGTAPVPDEDAE